MADYFQPYNADFVADPYPVYRRLRDEHPVLRSETLGLTLFSRYRDILEILRDSRFGRAIDPAPEFADSQPVTDRTQMPHYRRYVDDNLLEQEGETHSRLRCVLARSLGADRISSLADGIQHLAAARVKVARDLKSFEFLNEVAIPLTVTVIADLLGWPPSERYRLRAWSAQITRLYEKDCDAADELQAEMAATEFSMMINDLARSRKQRPRDDLISNLVAAEAKGQLRSRDELISSCMLMLNAGHEATVNASGNGLLALLRHSDQFNLLRQDPALLPGAIEEMLRYDSPLHLFHRYVLTDLDLNGIKLKRGEKVGLLYGSANRDPAMFDEPDRFDIRRRPNRHLAFGAESHFCLGSPLARLELSALFRQILKQMPNLKLVDDIPAYRHGFVFRGLANLRLEC